MNPYPGKARKLIRKQAPLGLPSRIAMRPPCCYLPIAAGALCLPALPFAITTLLGASIWNAGFLLTGHLLRGSGQDTFTIGLRIIVIVVALETAFMLALRYGPAAGDASD